MSDTSHLLHSEIRAATVLKEQLREIAGDDVDVIRDTIEGETSLNELIAAAAEKNVFDAGLTEGIKEVIDKMTARKDRIEKRIAHRRLALLAAMQTAELTKFVTPSGTLTRKALPISAIITAEDQIPSEFWKPQDPKLDKKAVLEALKSGADVPGAILSNGGETIQFRT